MYKILIVDDNPLILMGMKNMIRWDLFSGELVGEANNVSHALELIQEKTPDLVINDIRMPGKNGLYLLNEINDKYPEISTIVISAYDDFQYAKEAMKANCGNYILKPIDPAELNAAIKKAFDSKVSKKSNVEVTINKIKKGSLFVLKTRKNYSLSELYEILKGLKNVEIKKEENYLIFYPDCNYKSLEETLKTKVESGCLLGRAEITNAKSANEILKEANQKAAEKIFQNPHGEYKNVSETLLDEKKIAILCTTGNAEKTKDIFKGLVGNILNDPNRNIEMLVSAVDSFLQVLLSLDKETYADVKKLMDRVDGMAENLSYFSIDEIVKEVNRATENICAQYSRALGNKHDLVIKVKNMVQKNFQSDLSLFEIARLFYVTPSYLSRVFKQETGMNLNNYITEVRIETAEQLLRETDEKIVDIAHAVGYSDANYFTKVFKKITGLSPNNDRQA